MSDDFEPFATAGSGKSDPEVAFDLLNKLKGQGVWGERNMPKILDMYAECLDAVKGYRAYEGQTRIETPVQRKTTVDMMGSGAPNAPQNTQAQAPMPAPSQAAAHAQPQHQAPVQAPTQSPNQQVQPAPPANPVQSQHAQLQQQLYKQR